MDWNSLSVPANNASDYRANVLMNY